MSNVAQNIHESPSGTRMSHGSARARSTAEHHQLVRDRLMKAMLATSVVAADPYERALRNAIGTLLHLHNLVTDTEGEFADLALDGSPLVSAFAGAFILDQAHHAIAENYRRAIVSSRSMVAEREAFGGASSDAEAAAAE